MSSVQPTRGQLDLLLIGKTGNGKSATGNTILRKKIFKCVPNATSVTKCIQQDYSDYYGRCIKVVDGPGVGDTDMNRADALKLVMDNVQQAIAANPDGYHAFLLVVRFGGRFTNEDVQTIDVLKGIFGEDFVKNYCILLVTCGDNYDPEETEADFPTWCRQQTGVFRTLVNECDNRVILWDNRTKDSSMQNDQLNRLVSMVDSLSALGMRYSGEHFKTAQKNRERLMVESQAPIIREECLRETSLIIQQLSKVQLDEPENQLDSLDALLKRVESLLKSVLEQDRGTNALNAVIKNVQHVKLCIEEQITNAKQAIEMKFQKAKRQEEIERLRAEREANQRQMDEELRSELESKIKFMEEEQRQSVQKMETLESALLKRTAEAEEECRIVREAQTQQYINFFGRAIFDGLIPILLSIFGNNAGDDSEDETRRRPLPKSDRKAIRYPDID